MSELKLDDLLKDQPTTAITDMTQAQAETIAKQDLAGLSEKDRKEVDKIRQSLDLRDSSVANLYGASSQKNIAEFSNEVLKQVRAKDAGSVGALMTDLLVKVRNVHSEEEKGGFLSKIFGGGKQKIERFLASYDDLAGQIDAIAAKMQTEQKELLKQVELFDRMYQQNLEYYHDLELYIRAGEEQIAEMREKTLPSLFAEAKESDNPMAMQVVSDLEENVKRFEKKVHDLKISQTIALQSAPQIKLIQNNDQLLVNKIGDAINNTIPLWKAHTVIALGLSKQEEALEMQKSVSDATNKLLKENAAKLKQTSLGVQEEAERSIVDIETLEEANRSLIETIQGSIEISKKAQEQRKNAEEKMAQMKDDLRNALVDAMALEQ